MDMMSFRRMVMAQMGASGANFIKGSFTVPDSGTSYTLNFGKTFSKYIFMIEATDDTKAAIMETGMAYARTYFMIGVYPKIEINNGTVSYNLVAERIKPSTGEFTLSNVGTYTTLTSSSINIYTFDLSNTNAGNYLYYGQTYNYYVVEMNT